MSLKGFHILLISLSSLLALMFGGWSVRAWRETGEGSHLGFAAFSFLAAVGLVVYIVWFARKIRSREEEDRDRRKNIKPLVVGSLIWLVSARPADACNVCMGEASGPMIDGARMGVYLLFGLVLAVQVAFVLFFLHLRKQAKLHHAGHSH